MTIEQFEELKSILTLTNGLLMFLGVYWLLKDISKYISSFIKGGF